MTNVNPIFNHIKKCNDVVYGDYWIEAEGVIYDFIYEYNKRGKIRELFTKIAQEPLLPNDTIYSKFIKRCFNNKVEIRMNDTPIDEDDLEDYDLKEGEIIPHKSFYGWKEGTLHGDPNVLSFVVRTEGDEGRGVDIEEVIERAKDYEKHQDNMDTDPYYIYSLHQTLQHYRLTKLYRDNFGVKE